MSILLSLRCDRVILIISLSFCSVRGTLLELQPHVVQTRAPCAGSSKKAAGEPHESKGAILEW
jgi:hypothetical protein